MQIDHVRQLAAYSANLVLLRVVLGDSNSFNPSKIWAEDNSAMWRSTVTLWHSGLDLDGFQAITSILKRDEGLIRLMRPEEIMSAEWTDLLQMRLIGDTEAESRLRFGMAAYDRALYRQPGDSWKEVVLSALIPAISLSVNAPILLIREDEESVVFNLGGTNSGFDNYGIADLLQMSSPSIPEKYRASSGGS